MRRSIITLLAVATAFAGASAANATATFTFDDGTGGLSAGEVLYASFDPGSTGTLSGSGYQIMTGSDGNGADPAIGGQGDPYLSVLGGGSANFTFAGLSSLGLDYGSADDYNLFTLTFATGPDQVLTGSQIITDTANGDQSAPRTNGRLTFTATDGNAITGLTLTSSSNSLEVDNFGVKNAVPEPGTWAMMLIGFGAVGASLRRKRTPVLASAV